MRSPHQIANVMKATGAMNNYDIVVTFSEGNAKLQGTVTNEQQMKTAIDIAQASPHVNKVVNQLALAQIAPTATAIRPATPLSRPVRLSPVALSAQPAMQPPARAMPSPTQRATAPALQQPVFPQQVPQQQQLAALRAVPARTAPHSSRRAPTRPVAVAPSSLAVAQPHIPPTAATSPIAASSPSRPDAGRHGRGGTDGRNGRGADGRNGENGCPGAHEGWPPASLRPRHWRGSGSGGL